MGGREFRDKLLRPSGVSKKKVESEFGLKMLQKMGWKEDAGLGAEGEGMKECIQISRREELEGLGYAASRQVDDNWWKNSIDQTLKRVNALAKVIPKHDSSEEEAEESEVETKPVPKKKGAVGKRSPRTEKTVRERSRDDIKKKAVKQDSDYDSDDEEIFKAVAKKGMKLRQKATEAEDLE